LHFLLDACGAVSPRSCTRPAHIFDFGLPHTRFVTVTGVRSFTSDLLHITRPRRFSLHDCCTRFCLTTFHVALPPEPHWARQVFLLRPPRTGGAVTFGCRQILPLLYIHLPPHFATTAGTARTCTHTSLHLCFTCVFHLPPFSYVYLPHHTVAPLPALQYVHTRCGLPFTLLQLCGICITWLPGSFSAFPSVAQILTGSCTCRFARAHVLPTFFSFTLRIFTRTVLYTRACTTRITLICWYLIILDTAILDAAFLYRAARLVCALFTSVAHFLVVHHGYAVLPPPRFTQVARTPFRTFSFCVAALHIVHTFATFHCTPHTLCPHSRSGGAPAAPDKTRGFTCVALEFCILHALPLLHVRIDHVLSHHTRCPL